MTFWCPDWGEAVFWDLLKAHSFKIEFLKVMESEMNFLQFQEQMMSIFHYQFFLKNLVNSLDSLKQWFSTWVMCTPMVPK
jgi:hypothetical protein